MRREKWKVVARRANLRRADKRQVQSQVTSRRKALELTWHQRHPASLIILRVTRWRLQSKHHLSIIRLRGRRRSHHLSSLVGKSIAINLLTKARVEWNLLVLRLRRIILSIMEIPSKKTQRLKNLKFSKRSLIKIESFSARSKNLLKLSLIIPASHKLTNLLT